MVAHYENLILRTQLTHIGDIANITKDNQRISATAFSVNALHLLFCGGAVSIYMNEVWVVEMRVAHNPRGTRRTPMLKRWVETFNHS